MRLLLLIRDLDLGGAQRQMLHVATGLAERGHHVAVICWRGGGALTGEFASRGIQVTECHSSWRGNLVGLACRVRRFVRAAKLDIIYSMMPVENLVGLLACIGTDTKLVWGIRTSADALQHLPLSHRLLFALQRALVRWPDAIVANSQAGADMVSRSRPGARIVVVRNGTDAAQFRPAESSRASARKALGVDAKALVVAMIGRVERQKGIEEFLEAIEGVVSLEPGVVALLVGRVSREYESTVRKLIRLHGLDGHVVLAPEQREIQLAYAAIDVFVSPSLGEGMSNVVAEAMASGLAVIATRVGENASLIGPAGWLVAAGDPESLRLAIVAAIGADRSAVGVMARMRIESMYSVQGLVEQTESVLNRALIDR